MTTVSEKQISEEIIVKLPITFESEVKKEFRNWENWLEQIGNIVYSLFWSVGIWLGLSVLAVGFV